MDFSGVEDFAEWAAGTVLQLDGSGAQATGEGDYKVGAICFSHGKDSGTGGLILCADGGRK